MAADKLSVLLDLQTKQAEAEIRRLAKAAKSIGTGISGGVGSTEAGGKVRALGTGLSKATVNADEFSKSLEASNARVIAFGASAGLIMGVERAMKAMVKASLQVEKALADVNIIMNLNNKSLQQFSKGMFKVAKETAQSFDTVAEATTEFARQGLSMENTLIRTKDALILTRLTGMQAADSVKSLTAAVNSFNKEGLTSTEVINKMAKVDAAFAVSSEDLAKAISRVGSSAVDAGVSMDQLMAITTAVQQRTARGGAVIGNAFKTIFTRIQRTDVQQKLANIGVATRDMQGNMLDAVTVLQNLAGQFGNLSKAQQASIAENVAGVFQVNILRSALADLSSETALYTGALKASVSATDEAERKNASLNKTMDAFVNQTLANLTEAGAALGGDIFGPAINNVLTGVNGIIDAFKEGGALGGIGADLGKNLMKGLGQFIGGPGLIIVGVAFGRLAQQLAKFAGKAFKDMVGLGAAAKERLSMEESILRVLNQEPALLQQVENESGGIATVQQQIENTIRTENSLLVRQKRLARDVVRIMRQKGAMVSGGNIVMPGGGRLAGSTGVQAYRAPIGPRIPGRAKGGLIPNFANVSSAIGREMAAGVPASTIRVGSSSALKSSGNPAGIGVYNTKDEPGGLSQGIRRSASMGVNPKSHGIPNFAAGGLLANLGSRAMGAAGTTARVGAGSLAFMGMGAFGDSMGGRLLSNTAIGGAFGGLPGAGAGLVLGLVTEAITALIPASEDVTDALKEETAAQNGLAVAAKLVEERFKKANEQMSRSGVLATRDLAVNAIKKDPEFKAFNLGDRPEFKALETAKTERQIEDNVKALESFAGQARFSAGVKSLAFGMRNIDFDHGQYIPTRAEGNMSPSGVGPRAGMIEGGSVDKVTSMIEGMFERVLGSPDAFYRTQAASGDDAVAMFRTIAKEMKTGRPVMGGKDFAVNSMSLEAMLSKILGGPEAANKPFADRLREVIPVTELMKFKVHLATNFSSLEKLNKAREELVVTEKEGRKMSDVFKEAARLQEAFRKLAFTLKMNDEALRRNTTFNNAMASMDNQFGVNVASATMGSGGVAAARFASSNAAAGRAMTNAPILAQSRMDSEVAKGLAGLDFVKFAEGQGFTPGQASKALEAFENMRTEVSGKGGPVSREGMISGLRERLTNVKGLKLQQGAFQPGEMDKLLDEKFLTGIIDMLQKASNTYTSTVTAQTDQAQKNILLAQKKYTLDLEAIKLQYVLNTQKRQEQRLISAALAQQELSEAQGLVRTGQMGARGRNAAYSASLAADVSARGIQEGDYGRAFQAGFRNEFGYEGVDALQDFENGSRQVAQTMKSSFADAFQSIASGASTVQGALANMAQSILNSISSMSTQMMTNMMFSKMGFSEGGYVPGYNAGGLVTGGSGHKDDVLTKMQGGEFVVKKSAVNKIGLPTLNAINGYANGGSTGPSMGQLGLIAGGASALSGVIGAAMAPDPARPAPSTDYGFGRGQHGFFGGPDSDARGGDIISGGGTRAGVSLNKAFVYYRRDPETGQLISESRRPTEGRFEVSSRLSLLGRLGENDPQTSRMFDKEQTMAKYQDYLATETQSRKDQVNAVKDQKKGRLIGAYMNAAMLIGGAKFFGGKASGTEAITDSMNAADPMTATGMPMSALQRHGGSMNYGGGFTPDAIGSHGMPIGIGGMGSGANGGLAKVMGGEYVMSPEAVRTHGVGFMTELNRGNVPGFAAGGLYGNQTGPTINNGGSTLNTGGNTNNNVKININIDKSGKAEASADSTSSRKGPSERDDQEEVQNNKEFGDLLQSIVVKEIVQQQRPGGLLNRSTTGV